MSKRLLAAVALCASVGAPAVSSAQPPADAPGVDVQTGFASYYARKFEGRRTANGETFRNDSYTAAHPSLPFGTVVLVTCLERGRSVVVRITDRLPSRRAVIDLTQKAAAQLDMLNAGRTRVSVKVLGWGKEGAKALHQVAQQVPGALGLGGSAAAAAVAAAPQTDEPRER